MKRVFLSLLAIACLLTLLALPVLADRHSLDDADFSQSYITRYYNSLMTGRYNTGKGLTSSVRASTDVSLANDHVGVAKVTLVARNGRVSVSHSGYFGITGLECANTLTSGKAIVYRQNYAKRVTHTVWRSGNGFSSEITRYEVTVD